MELLLAIGLFSFLMTAVGSLIIAAARTHTVQQRIDQPLVSLEFALRRLEHDLQSAQPFFGVPLTGNGPTAALEFARLEPALSDDGPPASQWVRVRYRLEPTEDAIALVRETFLWSDAQGAGQPRHRETLVRVASLTFSFGALDAEQTLVWETSWDGAVDGVPKLIKLDGALPTSAGHAPIELSRVIRHPAGNLPIVEQP